MTAHATGAGLDTRGARPADAPRSRPTSSAGLYDGAVVMLGRHGDVALHEAIGFADRDTGRARRRPTTSSASCRSRRRSRTRSCCARSAAASSRRRRRSSTCIPEFARQRPLPPRAKDRITVGHLLTHRSGLPLTPTPVPYEQLGRLDLVLRGDLRARRRVSDPGGAVNYSPALNHALMGEILRRLSGDGISMRDLLRRDLFEPLGMTSTALGAPRAWADRLVPLKARFGNAAGWLTEHDVEVLNDVISEDAEMPWVGGVTSAEDVFRFAEMLRRGGEYDGVRYIAPAVLDLATRNQTGDKPNELYGRLAVAERLGGPPRATSASASCSPARAWRRRCTGRSPSPRTFGNYGAGSTIFWVDPERDLTFVVLTAGVLVARAEHPALPPPLRHGRGGSAVIALAEHSYMWVGVERVHGPDGTTVTAGEHMYVEYFVPQERTKPHPVILVHGGNGQGMAFLGRRRRRARLGAPPARRGLRRLPRRSPRPGPQPAAPVRRPGRRGGALRGGDARVLLRRRAPAAGRGPARSATRSSTSSWPSSAERPRVDVPQPVELYKRRGGELLEAIGPAILIMHSAGGPFGWVTADARPDLVKAIVSVEGLPPAMAGVPADVRPARRARLRAGARRSRRRVGPARPRAARRAGRPAAAAGEPVGDPHRLPEQRRPALLGDQPRRRAVPAPGRVQRRRPRASRPRHQRGTRTS